MRAWLVSLLPALLGATLCGACRGSGSVTDTPDARESPQASAQPALLATQPTIPASAATTIGSQAGPAPAPLRGDEPLPADPLTREPIGYTLSAAFRPADVMAAPRAPEVNSAGIDAARKSTELRVAIDLSPTRMRFALSGRGFVLPADTELRARNDRYGHVVVLPGAVSYRPLSPGSLRALLGERRFDVAPITPAEIALRDDSARRIGIRTRRAEVTTRAAHASFEIGRLEGAGEGGVLLCRLLLDLMNAPPNTPVCASDELPVRVELRWTTHGSLVFELTGVLRRTDIPLSALVTPPPSAAFASAPFSAGGMSSLLSPQELAALRFSDVEVPSSTPATSQLLVANSTLELRVLYLDGVPIAWAAPGARGEIVGLHRGRYVAQWRTFMGDAVETAVTQIVPGLSQVGAPPDAGK